MKRVLTLYLDTWYGSGSVVSSDRMLFGGGLFESCGFTECHVPLELWRDNKDEAALMIKRNYPYEFVFVVPYTDVLYDLPDLTQKAPIVVWMCDDVWRYGTFGRYWAPLASIMATTCPVAKEKYGEKGLLVNWACRTEWERYVSGIVKQDKATFRGQLYGDRVQKLAALSSSGSVPIEYSDTGSGCVKEEDYFTDMASGAFSLCLSGSSHGHPQMKSRMFEPQILGSLLVSEPAPGLEQYWEPDKECIIYMRPEDAQAKMTELLLDRPKFDAMTARARQRALAEHTYWNRIRAITSKLGI